MILLKQSTASQEVLLGPFLDSADGNTTEESLTIANTDIKIWKNGATTLADKNSGGATHISGGRYYAVLDATDTDTLGPLEIHVHVSGALAVRRACLVVTATQYDVLVGTTTPLTATTIADGILQRDISAMTESAAAVKSLYTAVAKAVNRTRDNAGTLEIYRSNGSTIHASQAITTDSANDPIDELGGAA